METAPAIPEANVEVADQMRIVFFAAIVPARFAAAGHADGAADTLGRCWQVDVLDARLRKRVDDRVRDNRQPWRDAAFAFAAHASGFVVDGISLILVSDGGSRSARGIA